MSTAANQDSDELESLFDSIVAETNRVRDDDTGGAPVAAAPAGPTSAPSGGAAGESEDMLSRIGHLTRSLHESLRELGYDDMIERAAQTLPDAQDRLQYVADMTEKAATRTLSATEAAQPIQDRIGADAGTLAGDWDRLFANELSVDEFRALAGRTREFLRRVPDETKATNGHLMEIMMAQDFQDLTGQVIKKMMEMTRQVEKQLLSMLIDNLPKDRKEQIEAKGLAGPVINPNSASDAVTDQKQVDELLESLGF